MWYVYLLNFDVFCYMSWNLCLFDDLLLLFDNIELIDLDLIWCFVIVDIVLGVFVGMIGLYMVLIVNCLVEIVYDFVLLYWGCGIVSVVCEVVIVWVFMYGGFMCM